mmetsp:Transcript_67732/g.107301  ORF Transcript_67732/g.107301 Transcript_67732/m.107301 type:complete len:264 (-) Transcript_67732:508-1299(-)
MHVPTGILNTASFNSKRSSPVICKESLNLCLRLATALSILHLGDAEGYLSGGTVLPSLLVEVAPCKDSFVSLGLEGNVLKAGVNPASNMSPSFGTSRGDIKLSKCASKAIVNGSLLLPSAAATSSSTISFSTMRSPVFSLPPASTKPTCLPSSKSDEISKISCSSQELFQCAETFAEAWRPVMTWNAFITAPITWLEDSTISPMRDLLLSTKSAAFVSVVAASKVHRCKLSSDFAIRWVGSVGPEAKKRELFELGFCWRSWNN